MWPESAERSNRLRSGFTTGTCATACCVAASERLFTGLSLEEVTVTLPKGDEVALPIEACETRDQGVHASTIKDAGDDPDITHGACVFVELHRRKPPGVRFRAGEGVGTVTRPGLPLALGEPAINPVPRRMMREHLARQALRFDYTEGFEVSVGIEAGAALARKTMNPRLGIVGGLSILGTSGIVRPYSCAAWIASIHQGIDVARACGLSHIAASTGNSSECAIRRHYGLEDSALVEMGDFAGAMLKYLRRHPVARLSICGGFGKISKLACRNRDLNSRKSSIDFRFLSGIAAAGGADRNLSSRILSANTSIEVLQMCREADVGIAAPVCGLARDFAADLAGPGTDVEVWAIDRHGDLVGHAPFSR